MLGATLRGESVASKARIALKNPFIDRFHTPRHYTNSNGLYKPCCRRAQTVATAAPVQAPAQGQQAAPPEIKYSASLQIVEVTPTITAIRSVSNDRQPAIEFGLKKGTTTNSYLLRRQGSSSFDTLIDVPSNSLDVDFIENLKVCGALDSLQQIIITRLTPERISVVAELLTNCAKPNIQLLATSPALQLLKDRAEGGDQDLQSAIQKIEMIPVSRGLEVQTAGDKVLRFITIPTPRWPDLTAVYSPSDSALFSSNFFSAHVASTERIDDGGFGKFGGDWRYYFDCMLAPVAKQTANALDRLAINAVEREGESGGPLKSILAPFMQLVQGLTLGADDGVAEPLKVSLVLPMHGPVIQNAVTELVGKYADWTAAQVKALTSASVLVMYASAYGNTASLAQAISRGIIKSGVGVETLNLEIASLTEVEEALKRASGFVIGSPTLGGHMPTQVQTALGATMQSTKSRDVPCGVFGSFGWSGEAVDLMERKLKDAGFRFAFDAIRVKFKPTEAALQLCEEAGTDVAQAVKKRAKKRERTAAAKLSVAETASGNAQALGRVVGSLCVLTAQNGDASSAMLASWVSQASFSPPGLTVAVKKDRAIESLLQENDTFVLNILAEGKEKATMKHLTKPFAPGQDRFSGLDVENSETTGAAILKEAASYLECTVESRMEAGDHYIVYASIQKGKVLAENAQSAVHFRKVGTNY